MTAMPGLGAVMTEEGEWMDYLTFIMGMTKALAWPTAALIIFAFTREHILALLNNLRKLKHGEWEANFREQLDEAKSQLESAGDDASAVPSDPHLLNLADQYPKLAIIETWQRIEGLAAQLSDAPNKLKPPPFWLNWAVDNRLISSEQSFQYLHLRNLRNLAAHSHEDAITRADAYEYIELAEALQKHLEKKLSEK